MNKTITNIFKGIALAVSWLTLSPLLFILDGRWKLLPKWLRIVLFVVSPMMLFVYGALALQAYYYYPHYRLKHHFAKRRVIENITGVEMPRYKVVERNYGTSEVLSRWHNCSYILEFKEIPDNAFYQALRNNGFEYQDGCYHFFRYWGWAIEKPKDYQEPPKVAKGIDGFKMKICEGDKRFEIFVNE